MPTDTDCITSVAELAVYPLLHHYQIDIVRLTEKSPVFEPGGRQVSRRSGTSSVCGKSANDGLDIGGSVG